MGTREKIAQSIYDKATSLDGDQIAVHLGNSMHIDGSARDAADLKRIVMGVCLDAADAVLDALMEPTEGMIEAGIETHEKDWPNRVTGERPLVASFRGMIRAARDGK